MDMITYSISAAKTYLAAKAYLSRILRDLDHGEEVIMTRRNRPCGRLTTVDGRANDKPSLATLRDAFSELPDADYQDFRNIRATAGRWRA